MAQFAAERQRRWRERQLAKGIVTVTVDVPASAASDVRVLAEALRKNVDLVIGPLRNIRSGRLVSVRHASKPAPAPSA
jgi:hypothetical protein